MSGNDEKTITEVWECQRCFPKYDSNERFWVLQNRDADTIGWLLWPSATHYRQKYGGPVLMKTLEEPHYRIRGSAYIFSAYCPFCREQLVGADLINLRSLIYYFYQNGGISKV